MGPALRRDKEVSGKGKRRWQEKGGNETGRQKKKSIQGLGVYGEEQLASTPRLKGKELTKKLETPGREWSRGKGHDRNKGT